MSAAEDRRSETVDAAGAQWEPPEGKGRNSACFCLTLDRDRLLDEAGRGLRDPELARLVLERWRGAVADLPVFLGETRLQEMVDVVDAIEQVVRLPKWREEALASAPEIARHDPNGAKGIFLGYDFHVTESAAPALIEINTNAGGALLNTLLARSHRACCGAVGDVASGPSGGDPAAFEDAIVEMFRSEWRQSHNGPLHSVVIVDERPGDQYLYPEFLLFRELLHRHGIQATVADPSELQFGTNGLRHDSASVDLVYNRLTDFYFERPDSAALRSAYLSDSVVVTPHPQSHAIYADKRRLAWLSDAERLLALGVSEKLRSVLLRAVPKTVEVTPENSDALWSRRKALFFKPVHGFGARAAYRGDKLTKSAWSTVTAGAYVAQELAEPGRRAKDSASTLKFDVRNYVYAGQIQWLAARLYQGQTTNFRTPGGGFAPVYIYSAPDARPKAAGDRSHSSYLFLLEDSGDVHPIPHALYVALARGEASGPQFANQKVRVADWHVRLRDGAPETVVKEWYGWAEFTEHGHFDPVADPPADRAELQAGNVDVTALPTADERERMSRLLWPGRGREGSSPTA